LDDDERLFVQSRQEALKDQIVEAMGKFQKKQEIIRSRRYTVSQVEQYSEEMIDKFSLPAIHPR